LNVVHVDILAIGAHPDDVELGCGGLLLKAVRNGHRVFICTLTRGSASGDPRERTEELMKSAKFIGAKDVQIGDFQDTKLTVSSELINYIEAYVDKVNPDLILTHFHGDIHHDHRAVSTATLESARFNSNILAYEIPLTRNFEPKVYFDISEVIDEKVELIRIYWSQRSKLYTKANAIKGLAEFRALQSRLNTSIDYVESFDVLKLCLDTEFKLQKVHYDRATAGEGFQSLESVAEPVLKLAGGVEA
jgi:LmbE family N-acetylglucosaminyl deacetylase